MINMDGNIQYFLSVLYIKIIMCFYEIFVVHDTSSFFLVTLVICMYLKTLQ